MSEDPPRRFVPPGLPLDRYPLASPEMERSFEAVASRPSDPEGMTTPAPAYIQEPPPLSQRLPEVERRTIRLVSVLFTLAVLGWIAFCITYVIMHPGGKDLGLNQNLALGISLGVGFLGLGVGLIVLARKLVPTVVSVQHRSPHHSSEDDELAAEEQLIGGIVEMGIAQRRILRRTLLAGLGLLPLPFIFSLRDLGPRPESSLRDNAWKADDRLIDPDTGRPLKLGDLAVGGLATVMPEAATDATKPINAESLVAVIRLPAGANKPLPGRASWAVDDHVAYSKICTHAGCPVAQYQVKQQALVCPCHQSKFDVPNGCRVLYGPAARSLPQLPIYVDDEGYFRARRPFDVPLGPSFWERPKT